jgi:hypothetical protein
LTRNHVLVIEGMDKRSPFPAAAFTGRRIRLIETGAVQDDFGAVPSRSRHLCQRCGEGHPYLGPHSNSAGMVGHSLSVIAGGCGYQTSVPLFGSQHQEFVQRSAFFERTSSLQVLQLKKDGPTRYARELVRLRRRGNADAWTNAAKRVLYVVERNHL